MHLKELGKGFFDCKVSHSLPTKEEINIIGSGYVNKSSRLCCLKSTHGEIELNISSSINLNSLNKGAQIQFYIESLTKLVKLTNFRIYDNPQLYPLNPFVTQPNII